MANIFCDIGAHICEFLEMEIPKRQENWQPKAAIFASEKLINKIISEKI